MKLFQRFTKTTSIVSIFVCLLYSEFVFAEIALDEKELVKIIESELTSQIPLAQVSEVKILVTTQDGNPVNMKWTSRFEADVAFQDGAEVVGVATSNWFSLYEAPAADGPTTNVFANLEPNALVMISSILEPSTTLIASGIIESTYRGSWSHRIRYDQTFPIHQIRSLISPKQQFQQLDGISNTILRLQHPEVHQLREELRNDSGSLKTLINEYDAEIDMLSKKSRAYQQIASYLENTSSEWDYFGKEHLRGRYTDGPGSYIQTSSETLIHRLNEICSDHQLLIKKETPKSSSNTEYDVKLERLKKNFEQKIATLQESWTKFNAENNTAELAKIHDQKIAINALKEKMIAELQAQYNITATPADDIETLEELMKLYCTTVSDQWQILATQEAKKVEAEYLAYAVNERHKYAELKAEQFANFQQPYLEEYRKVELEVQILKKRRTETEELLRVNSEQNYALERILKFEAELAQNGHRAVFELNIKKN